MALLYMDSFDHYATADIGSKWTTVIPGDTTYVTAIASGGRHSSNALSLKSPNASDRASAALAKVLTPGDATIITGFAYNPGLLTLHQTGLNPEAASFFFGNDVCTCAMAVRASGVCQAFLRVNSDGTLSACRGSGGNGTVLATSSATLTSSIYQYLEVKITIHDTAGVFIVRLNGNPTPIINLSGIDTQGLGTAGWTDVRLGRVATNSSTVLENRWDDLYVLDGTGSAPWNDFLGDVRCDAVFPTGAGATTGWTPSTGANYAAVDETAPNGDTDYVTAPTVPLTDTYVTQDLPVAGSAIFGVQHNLYMKKADAGTCALAPVVRQSGVDYVGSNLFPSTGWSYGVQIAPTNPATGLQWLESDFNADEFGMKRTA